MDGVIAEDDAEDDQGEQHGDITAAEDEQQADLAAEGSPVARSLEVEKDMEGMESSMPSSSDEGCRNCTIMNDKLENMQKSLNSMLASVDRKWEILRLETREMREAIEAILKLNLNKVGFSNPSIEKEDREEFEKMLPIHNLDEFIGLEEKLKEESQRNLLKLLLRRIQTLPASCLKYG
ncbi:uncharacterized protein LOC120350346 isoform X2 [Nilaparvata lugens]|uniref:uncharacterized protein LOC120350346 isoform X2 n=1 Tax=Nilaparvata lugens TaxID=108931 RepID=UPI00193D7BCD|nr:uncharacterized protein LOC120350346 isoform X2 [Nilaparvata lugens]